MKLLKNLCIPGLIAALVCIAIISCGPADTPPTTPKEPTTNKLKIPEGAHILTRLYDCSYESAKPPGKGEGNMFMVRMISYPTNELGGIIDDGYSVQVTFNTPLPDLTKPQLEIPSGTYLVDGLEPSLWGISTTSYLSSVIRSSNGEIETLQLTGGEMRIQGNFADGYVVVFDLELEDGTTLLAGYEGKIVVDNPYIHSTLTENLDIGNALTGSSFVTVHPYYTGRDYTFDLFSDGIDIESYEDQNGIEHSFFVGDGHIIRLELIANETNEVPLEQIPTGTYQIRTSFDGGTAYAGEYYMTGTIGCWYYEYIGSLPAGKKGPLVGGTVTVEYSAADEVYTIAIDALDDIGHSVKAQFNGILPEFRHGG